MAAEELRPIAARIPATLFAAVEELAAKNDRSVSAELRIALRAHVDGEQPEPTEQAA